MPEFIPGLVLSELFYREAVAPILRARFPGLVHSAGLLDFGSDVLGFDTPQSRDHGWGPRCQLFVAEREFHDHRSQVQRVLAEELPQHFRGYSTSFCDGDRVMDPDPRHPVRHWVEVLTVAGFCISYLGVVPAQPMAPHDWLTIPSQRLRTVASGKVFHDGLGKLAPMREKLAWYPHDLWLYVLACQWQKVSQDEPFMARCGDLGDEVGSRLLAGRLIDHLMHLCLLMARQYPPYVKWLGTAFSKLPCATELIPTFQRTLNATAWKQREAHLSQAYLVVARLHNELNVTSPVAPAVAPFHTRPYLVPHAERHVKALRAAVSDPEALALPPHVGAVWQFADSTDVLDSIARCRQLAVIYGADGTGSATS